MKRAMWIGPADYAVGEVGFLVSTSNPYQGSESYALCDVPAHTNQSRQPRLHGWCGSWNNVSTYGRGMACVEKIARNGRAFVRLLEGDELAAALEDLGYPELAAQEAVDA